MKTIEVFNKIFSKPVMDTVAWLLFMFSGAWILFAPDKAPAACLVLLFLSVHIHIEAARKD